MPRFAREPSREDNNTPDLFHSNKKEKKKEGKKGEQKRRRGEGGIRASELPSSESPSWKEKALNWPADANSRFNIFHDRDKSTY